MKKTYIFLFLISFGILFFSGLTFAQPSTQVNYTTGSYGLSINQLNYQPYPANPGEYIDMYIQVTYLGGAPLNSVTFQLNPTFPFSLDQNQTQTFTFNQLTGSQPIILHYRVRVDSNAVPGDNELDLNYYIDGNSTAVNVQKFEIQVQNAQTAFDVVVQQSTGTQVSLGIANIGENTANSLIVRVPAQNNYMISGTNAQIVGNLNAGDYSIASFTLSPIRRGNTTLVVELDYTDNIGVRRDVIENVDSISNSPVGNFTALYGGNFTRGNFTRTSSSSGSIFTSGWFWLMVVLVVGSGVYIKKNPQRVKSFFSGRKEERRSMKEKNSKETPDWVSSERKKKR